MKFRGFLLVDMKRLEKNVVGTILLYLENQVEFLHYCRLKHNWKIIIAYPLNWAARDKLQPVYVCSKTVEILLVHNTIGNWLYR